MQRSRSVRLAPWRKATPQASNHRIQQRLDMLARLKRTIGYPYNKCTVKRLHSQRGVILLHKLAQAPGLKGPLPSNITRCIDQNECD